MRVYYYQIAAIAKAFMGDINAGGKKYIPEVGIVLDHHDQIHLQVAKLPPVHICGHYVTGVGGICIPEFGTQDNLPLYDGMLDEARVGLTQLFLDGLSVVALVRVARYMVFVFRQGDNPIRVLVDCYKSTR